MIENLIDAEENVVSACWIYPDSIRFATDLLTSAEFSDSRLGALYALIIGMNGAGVAVTYATVQAEARRRDPDGHIYPDATRMAAIASAMRSPEEVRYFAEIVRGEATRRSLQAACQSWHHKVGQADDPSQIPSLAAADFARIRDEGRVGGLEAKTLGELLEGTDEYDWVIPGLLEKGDRFVLTGTEGGGKTTLIRQIAVCAAAGLDPFTFEPIDPVNVLYIDVENSEAQWRRNARGMATKAASSGGRDPRQHMRIMCSARMDITKDRALGAIHRLVDEHKPSILVIGPLYKLVPGAIQNDDDAAPLITALDSLRDRGLVLLMEAHAGHTKGGTGERDLRPRGSSALLGWPEFGYGITHSGADENVWSLVRWRGDRDQRHWPEALARGGVWPWNDVNYRPGVPAAHWSER